MTSRRFSLLHSATGSILLMWWRSLPPGFRAPFRRQIQRAREAWFAARSRLRRRPGVEESAHHGIVVSLTSIPERLDRLHLSLESLLSQSLKPARVVLWLAEGVEVPRAVVRLTRFGVTVQRGDDLGPHTKLLHSLAAYPSSILVTADDDVVYPHRWLKGLYRSYQEHPRSVHCYRARKICHDEAGDLLPLAAWDYLTSADASGPGMLIFPTGVGGVLYPPGSIHPEVFNRERFRVLCPTNDDIWFKAMSVLRGWPARKAEGRFNSWRFQSLGSSKRKELWAVNRAMNDRQVRDTFEAYRLNPYLRSESS